MRNLYEHWLDGEWTEDASVIPAGSPERVLKRYVLTTPLNGERYVFEGSAEQRRGHRECQAKMLHTLASRGCPGILPWLKSRESEWGVEADGYFWQCRRYADGIELNRATYAGDAWRGRALAAFLNELRRSSDGVGHHHHPFYLGDYAAGLLPLIQQRNANLFQDLQPIIAELQPLFSIEKELRLCFCHGDFHPLNVLWGEQGITAVIDWEFAGMKPAVYDAANMVGCIGMDHPENLTGPMVMAFLQGALSEGVLSPQEVKLLPDYMAALRLGWMREWCWRNEKEMMVQELDFLWLLLDNRELLAQKWLNA